MNKDTLGLIFKRLGWRDRYNCYNVNHDWRRAIIVLLQNSVKENIFDSDDAESTDHPKDFDLNVMVRENRVFFNSAEGSAYHNNEVYLGYSQGFYYSYRISQGGTCDWCQHDEKEVTVYKNFPDLIRFGLDLGERKKFWTS